MMEKVFTNDNLASIPPYFLNLGPTAKERQIEKALLERIKEFLLELGSGFAFLGNQYPLEVEGRTYYLDLLFYHYKLRCLVAIELKVGEFEPEFAGKMNFYLNALNHEMKHPSDNPSVGIILCHEKKHLTTQYALEGMTRPIGVSTYTTQLPPELQGSLPTPEQFEELLNEGRNE